MAGFLADADLSINAIEQARLRAVARDSAQGGQGTGGQTGLIDLTSTNPTAHGLHFPAAVLRGAADRYWTARDDTPYSPDARGALPAREAIRGYYQARGAVFPADDIFLTASTSESYSLLFSLLTEPGDNVLGPDVSYPLFEHLAALHHIELRPYRLDPARGFAIDPASMAANADARTRAVLIISPHNPTGAIVQLAIPALDALGLPLIVDEVFAEFTVGVARTPVVAGLHPALPVFTLNGASKMFALPDLKLGWMALSARAAQTHGARLELLNDAFLSASAQAQHMLPALFEQREFVSKMTARTRENVAMALEMLAGCPRVKVHRPDGGYVLFPRVAGIDDADGEERLVLHLIAHGVLAHPGFFYGPGQPGHVMLSCLPEPKVLRAGLARFAAAVAAFE